MISIKDNIRVFLEERKYVILLIAYVLVLWAPIIFQSLNIAKLISDISLFVLVLAILNFIERRTFFRKISIVMLFSLVFGKSVSLGLENENIDILTWCFMLFYFSAFLVKLLKNVWNAKKVNINTILGAIAGYIQIGVIAFILFKICDLLYNGTAFSRNVDVSEIIYFSFVTLTTVGYGDITPATDETKAFTVIFAMVGQFYMAILMALLVGKYQQEHQK